MSMLRFNDCEAPLTNDAIATVVSNDATEDTFKRICADTANIFSSIKPSNTTTDRKGNGRRKTRSMSWDRMGGVDGRKRTIQQGEGC